MAATSSYQHQQQRYSDFRPFKILNRDDSCFARIKTQTLAKRKSAVELLQETKPLYVKSEIVLDRKQELRRSLRGYQLPNEEDVEEVSIGGSGLYGGCRSNNSASPPPSSLSSNVTNFNSTTCYNNASQNNSSNVNGNTNVPFPLPKSPRLILPPVAFRKSTCSLQLQNKLRKLLNADSKENLLETSSVTATSDIPSVIQKPATFECYNSRSEFASNDNLDGCELNNFSCHKSLPDLTNALRNSLTSRSEKSDITSYEFFSDETGKKSTHTDSLAAASCKNDRLHASTDCCKPDDENNKAYFEDETNGVDQRRENSLPASPVKSCTSYITPPPLYCDTR